jgi:ATP-dependent Zn protease
MSANWSRNAFVYLLIIVAAATLFINIYQPGEAPQQISLTQLANKIKAGEVETVIVRNDELQVVLVGSDGAVISRREIDVPITQTLAGLGVAPEELAGVNIKYEAPGNATNWLSLLVNLLPLVFIGALFFILFRQT